MRCPDCGSLLRPDNQFCGMCGAARPALPHTFVETERQFERLQAQYRQGMLSDAAFANAMRNLVVTDSEGEYWILGARTREWYRFTHGQWQRADPALVHRAGTSPQAGPRMAWLGWLLGGIALTLIFLTGIIVLGILPGQATQSSSPAPTLPAVTQATVPPIPTETSSPTVTTTTTFSSTPSVTPANTFSPTPSPTHTVTASPTSTPSPTSPPATATVTATAIATDTVTMTPPPPAAATHDRISAPPGYVTDFEEPLTWRRGNQPYGELTLSKEQVAAGEQAGRLAYDFPAVQDNFVVFQLRPPVKLPDQPTGVEAQIAGDGSGHFLNVWILDAQGEVRSYTFGRIQHRGYRTLIARFDDAAGWPNGHISGPDNGVLDYPIQFYALVLDGVPDEQASRGALYLDDLRISEHTPVVTGIPTPTSPAKDTTPETGLPAGLSGRIAFPVFAPERGVYDIYVAEPDGDPIQRVIDFASQPALSPDGSQLAFRNWQSDQRGLAIMNTYGGNVQRLTNFLEDALPAWSPDGQSLVFLSRRESDRKTRLYMVKRASGGDWELGSPIFGEYPTFMADGRILYRATWPEHGLVSINRDGGDARMLFADGSVTAPAVSADGRYIAFMSQRDGGWDLYRLQTDGSGLLRLTSHAANDGLPAWSPDSSMIAFLSDRDGAWGVWAMTADGNGQRKLFTMPGSPEGYVTNEAGFSSRGWLEERLSWGP